MICKSRLGYLCLLYYAVGSGLSISHLFLQIKNHLPKNKQYQLVQPFFFSDNFCNFAALNNTAN